MLSVVRALKQVGDASVRPVIIVSQLLLWALAAAGGVVTIAAGILRHIQLPQ